MPGKQLSGLIVNLDKVKLLGKQGMNTTVGYGICFRNALQAAEQVSSQSRQSPVTWLPGYGRYSFRIKAAFICGCANL